MHNRTSRTNRLLVATLITPLIALATPASGQLALNEDLKILPTAAAAGDQFGVSTAIDNGIVAVGARSDDDNGQNSGSVSLFDAITGNRIAKLLPNDGEAGDSFGTSVAISNGIAVVGAFADEDNGYRSGSAYLFDADPLSPNFGDQLAKLIQPTGAANDWFGRAVAIDNGIVVIGALGHDGNGTDSGSVSFFDANPLSPDFGDHLFDRYPSSLNPADDGFGGSVAIDNGIVVIGATGDDTNGLNAGAVYLFNTGGIELAKLLPANGAAGDAFGGSISIDNGIVAIGAPLDSSAGFQSAGAAYLFDVAGNELITLFPNDSAAYDNFGHSVSINNGTVVIGAQYNDDYGSDSGSAYIFDATNPLSPGFGMQITKILPSDGATNDWFGYSIAIDNGIISVGAYRHSDYGPFAGSVYTFDISGVERLHLLPNGGSSFEGFGYSIAIGNNIIVVGAPASNAYGIDSGLAYVFDANTGDFLFKLFPNFVAADDFFGSSVAIDDTNDIIAVGAWGDDTNSLDAGAAYLFDANTGVQIAKLLPNFASTTTNDYLGVSISIDNNIVAVGAWGDDTNGSSSGAAYIFKMPPGGWTGIVNEDAKLLPTNGTSGDRFGSSISIDNGIVVVGSDGDNYHGSNSGSAYIFETNTGTQIAKLVPSIGASNEFFGVSAAIDNDTIAIGAYSDNINGLFSGSAYVFERPLGGWAGTLNESAKLLPINGAAFERFGVAIAIDNGAIAVGASGNATNGTGSGSVYVFGEPVGGWFGIVNEHSQTLPRNGEMGDNFGWSVSIKNNIVAAGALGDDDNGTDSGSAYTINACPADLDGNGSVDIFDFFAFLNAYNLQDPLADLTGDGIFNIFDVFAYLNLFNAGCP